MTAERGFAFTTRTEGPNTIIELAGELDIVDAPELRDHIGIHMSDRAFGRLILDLAKLTFIDSSGLAVLVWADRRLSERGEPLALVAPSPLVRKVLRVTGLHNRLNIHPTMEAALDCSLRRPAGTDPVPDAAAGRQPRPRS